MKAHVLLVEDEERLRIALTDRLREEGFAVDSLSDGDAAFEKITTEPFDMLILGLRLPGRNGLDLCRDIRASGIKTPILLLMAHSAPVQAVTALKLGADAYLTKPFDLGELLARTEALLRRTATALSPVRHFGSICVDLSGASVTRNGDSHSYFCPGVSTPQLFREALRRCSFPRAASAGCVGLRYQCVYTYSGCARCEFASKIGS